MASRLGWLGIGVTIGSIATIKVERTIRRKIRAISPDSVVHNLTKELTTVSEDFISSVKEGIHVVRLESSRSVSSASDLRRGKIEEFALKMNSKKVLREEKTYANSETRCLGDVSDTRERLVR